MNSEEESSGPTLTAKRRNKRINRKTKLHIVFDENARREFLTGFRKRKLQRKQAAKEDFEKKLKTEKKRIKLESKEQYKKLVHSYKPIPELEETFAQEYEVDDAKISVLELDTDLLAETNFIIGRNRTQYVKYEDKEEKVKEEPEDEHDQLPGMELKTKKEVMREQQIGVTLKTKKEIQRNIKKLATKTVKKSKIFNKMNQMERQKQKKKSMKKKKEELKIKAKSKKGKHSRGFKKKKQ